MPPPPKAPRQPRSRAGPALRRSHPGRLPVTARRRSGGVALPHTWRARQRAAHRGGDGAGARGADNSWPLRRGGSGAEASHSDGGAARRRALRGAALPGSFAAGVRFVPGAAVPPELLPPQPWPPGTTLSPVQDRAMLRAEADVMAPWRWAIGEARAAARAVAACGKGEPLAPVRASASGEAAAASASALLAQTCAEGPRAVTGLGSGGGRDGDRFGRAGGNVCRSPCTCTGRGAGRGRDGDRFGRAGGNVCRSPVHLYGPRHGEGRGGVRFGRAGGNMRRPCTCTDGRSRGRSDGNAGRSRCTRARYSRAGGSHGHAGQPRPAAALEKRATASEPGPQRVTRLPTRRPVGSRGRSAPQPCRSPIRPLAMPDRRPYTGRPSLLGLV